MGVLDLLAVVNAWAPIRIFESRTLTGEQEDILGIEGAFNGWIFGIAVSTDNPEAGITIEIDVQNGQTVRIPVVPKELMDRGLIAPNQFGPYAAVYDEENGRYEAVFAPGQPYPVMGQIRLWLNGPAGAKVNYDVQLVQITDIERFKEEVAGVISAGQAQPSMPPTGGTVEIPVELGTVSYRGPYTGFLP